MSDDFVLPPRVHFTPKERRRNALLDFAKRMYGCEQGLRVVHSLKQDDEEMRWLAELFPFDQTGNTIPFHLRLGEWCAGHPDDARAVFHLADTLKDCKLMVKAAEMGDARAMAEVSFLGSGEKKFQLARASAEKGDAFGTYCLMQCFMDGSGCVKDDEVALELLERAADLGTFWAYRHLVQHDKVHSPNRMKLLTCFIGISSFEAY